MAKLEVRGLTKSYKKRRVVDGIDLEVTSGEVVGLLGPNGAGKTTTFYMMVGLVRPDGGVVNYEGEDISALPMYKRARKGIGYLPQEASIFRKLTVRDNIMAILETLNMTKEEMDERLANLLNDFRITHIADSYGFALSGGERRRVEISRALVTSPSFILLDEPFSGIDPIAVIDIQNIIIQLKNRGIGVVISDHNVRETLGVCDRAYIVNEGKVMESGSPDVIVNSEKARKIYLGEKFTL
ncbi:MAG: LPS export ABC transporter ATP-binding protein [Deltaproteobacteria bacterium]|nr:LPS export ABC transporter ATP-binding protein [Deltaproteobacteria bacterium]